MGFVPSILTKNKIIITKIAIWALFVISILSPIYFMPSYLSTNSSGFHGGGYDFLAYYSAGNLASNGEIGKIYDNPSLSKIQKEIIAENNESQGFMTFLNPPYIAYILAPLTMLSIGNAQIAWLLITFILAVYVAYMLASRVDASKYYKSMVFIIILNLFPFWQNYRQGQLGLLILFFTLVGVRYQQKGKHYHAGACLSILLIKPHLALLVLVGLLIFRQRKVIYGMLVTFALTVMIFLPLTGTGVYVDYARHLVGVTVSHASGAGSVVSGAWEGSLRRTYGLNGAVTKIIGQSNYRLTNLIVISTAIPLLGVLAYVITKKGVLEKKITRKYLIVALVLFGLMINLHLYAYDLVYLIAAVTIIYPRKINLSIAAIILLTLEISAVDYLLYLPIFTLLLVCGYLYYCNKTLEEMAL